MTFLRKTRRPAGMLAALLTVALVAMAGAAPSGQPVRIGSTLALTGPLAQTARSAPAACRARPASSRAAGSAPLAVRTSASR